MRYLLKSWFKSFLFSGIFGFAINVLYLAVPVYVMLIYDKALFSHSLPTLMTLSVGAGIALLLMGVMAYIRSALLSTVANDVAEKLGPLAYEGMHTQAAGLDKKSYTWAMADLRNLRDVIASGHVAGWMDLPWIGVYLAILYLIHATLGWTALSCFLLTLAAQALLTQLGKKRYAAADIVLATESQLLDTSLRNAELIWGMGMLPGLFRRFDKAFGSHQRLMAQMDWFLGLIGACIRTTVILSPMIVVGVGTYIYFQGEISSGYLFGCVMITARLFFPFAQRLQGLKQGIEAMAGLRRLLLLTKEVESASSMDLPTPEGRLTLEAVTIRLGDRVVLNNIACDIAPGETLGVIGPQSSGKTVLCKTILGIWPPLAGKVRIDGAEMSQWSREALGPHLGYLPEEPELFPGTVAENIARMQEPDSEKVIAACRKAGIHDMILKLPGGYDTKIDQTGKNMSAGQRKLIALARALYGDPKLVVLDDPQNHLDDSGVGLLLNAITALKKEKTTVVLVADRTNLLMQTDKALVIKEGQVAMYGPSKEVFTQLANQQKAQ